MNTRSLAMWSIIKGHYDFTGKKVVDLGCGYGDLLTFAALDGAYCIGLDQDSVCLKETTEKLSATHAHFTTGRVNLNDWGFLSRLMAREKPDCLFCTSVLPYLDSPIQFMLMMQSWAPASFLEVQYNGDGPGPAWAGDDDMIRQVLLDAGWNYVEPIGTTYTGRVPPHRTIWMCRNG